MIWKSSIGKLSAYVHLYSVPPPSLPSSPGPPPSGRSLKQRVRLQTEKLTLCLLKTSFLQFDPDGVMKDWGGVRKLSDAVRKLLDSVRKVSAGVS